MYPPEVFAALRRRWMFVLGLLLLTAGGTVLAADVHPVYRASEVFSLQPPITADVPNTMKGLYPSLAITGAAIGERLSSPEARARYRAAGVTGEYTFAPRNSGTTQTPAYRISSMTVIATGTDPDNALHSLSIVTDAFGRELESLQDEWNVDQTQRITIATLAPPSAEKLQSSRKRAIIGAVVLGGLISVVLPLWIDRTGRRRRLDLVIPDELLAPVPVG